MTNTAMTKTWPVDCRRSLRLIGALMGLSVVLAACTTTEPDIVTATVPGDYRQRHPIAVEEANRSIVIFVGKVLSMIFFFMWVRWTVPRFRYDQVMKIGWQKLLPLSIANLIFYALAIAFIQK